MREQERQYNRAKQGTTATVEFETRRLAEAMTAAIFRRHCYFYQTIRCNGQLRSRQRTVLVGTTQKDPAVLLYALSGAPRRSKA